MNERRDLLVAPNHEICEGLLRRMQFCTDAAAAQP
jgi:hypothetical protein